MGSDLVIRVSPLQEAFQDITQECSIGEIITEEEVEHRCAALKVLTLQPQQKHACTITSKSWTL